MNREEKFDFLFNTLIGITRKSATSLLNVEGLVDKVREGHYEKNPDPRPICPVSREHLGRSTGAVSQKDYREAMVKYLGFWVELPPILSQFAYESLADYFNSNS